jgi:hypothetical protein
MSLPNQISLNYRLIHDSELSYAENANTVAAQTLDTILTFAAGLTNQAINLATLFPALTSLVAITLVDVSVAPGIGFLFDQAFPPAIAVRPLSFASWGANVSGTLPTLYVSNPSATLPLNLQVIVSGS